ncbi:hypothetical protein [Thalassospira lucentensis]|uniref:hypothetical protein n=1 Tax=Thalassospira lucentensis TaxID=168935 RepID=UPI003AA9D101
MTDEIPSVSEEDLKAIFANSMNWAQLNLTYEEILSEAKSVVKDMGRYSLTTALPVLSGLLTLPEYQSNTIRLELLVALAVLSCSGHKKASVTQVSRWYRELAKTRCVSGEDPAEDVFVTNVSNGDGNYLLLEGVWENAGFYTQRIVDLVETLPDTSKFNQLRQTFRAILKVSDEICRRSGLQRYVLGQNEGQEFLKVYSLPRQSLLAKRVTFTSSELQDLGIKPQDIAPVCSPKIDHSHMLKQAPGFSVFEHQVLFQIEDDQFVVAMPSALSVCARNLVLRFMEEEGFQEKFDSIFSRMYSDLIFHTPLLGGRANAPVRWASIQGTHFASFSMEVDTGIVLTYLLFLPSIFHHKTNGFKSLIVDEGPVGEQLSKLIDQTVAVSEKETGFKKGQIILVGCGWGKGHDVGVRPIKNPAWQIESISIADLVRVSWLDGMSPEYFIQVQDGLKAAEDHNLQVFNLNGVLNLIAWSRQNNGHIIPHGMFLDYEIEDDRPNLLNFPQDLLRKLRAEADQNRDLHAIQDHLGKWRSCQSARMGHFFKSGVTLNLYNCLDSLRSGELLTVVEDDLNVWATVTAPNFPSRETAFRLWEMVQEWLPRVLCAVKSRLSSLKVEQALLLELLFLGDDEISATDALPSYDELQSMVRVEPSKDTPNYMVIVFSEGFIAGFRHSANYAERVVVKGLFNAIMRHLRIEALKTDTYEFVEAVVQNTDARSFHAIYGHEFLQYVANSLPRKLVTLSDADHAIVKLGLAQKAGFKRSSGKIQGVDNCCSFLGGVVDRLIAELKSDLSRFGRREALNKIFLNVEKSHADEDHWRRTSAAIIGLHGRNPETLDVYVKQSSEFAGASVSGRILLEIGLCDCPEVGEELSNMELSRMMAKASVLYMLGGLSDAIRYRALSAELSVSPFGDVLVKDDFGEFVVQPVLAKMISQRFQSLAPRQHQNYEEPRVVTSVEEHFEAEFLDAWSKEFGFTVDEGRHFITLLEDEGIRKEKAVYESTRSELIVTLCKNGTSEAEASKFIDTFSLRSRANWASPPKSFAMRDIYPWAFSRRLSVVSRPILQFDNGSDEVLLIAPHSLRSGFRLLLIGAYSAELPQNFFNTDELRNKWWGKAGEGHAHAQKISEKLQEHGWQTALEITLPHILNMKLSRDFGDIDVLAWREGHSDIWVIEGKDLSRARNYSEMAHMLSEYQGKAKNEKPDKLLRHLRRVEVLEGSKENAAKFCGVSKPVIKSALICSGVVPMQYAKIEALEGTFVGSVEELIKSLVGV